MSFNLRVIWAPLIKSEEDAGDLNESPRCLAFLVFRSIVLGQNGDVSKVKVMYNRK